MGRKRTIRKRQKSRPEKWVVSGVERSQPQEREPEYYTTPLRHVRASAKNPAVSDHEVK
jgi:hypothetical protein